MFWWEGYLRNCCQKQLLTKKKTRKQSKKKKKKNQICVGCNFLLSDVAFLQATWYRNKGLSTSNLH